MKATDIEPGDMLIGKDGALIYTVVRPLADRHDDGNVVILVRYEVDGGTDTRTFDPEQDVPLTRVRPIRANTSTIEERRAARVVLRRTEEAAAAARDALRGLRSRGADAAEIDRAEIVYRDACRAEDDAALVVDRLNQSQMSGLGDPDLPTVIPPSGLTPGGTCRA